MNQFLFVVRLRDGREYLGTCKADGGSLAREAVESWLSSAFPPGDLEGRRVFLHGVQSKTFQVRILE